MVGSLEGFLPLVRYISINTIVVALGTDCQSFLREERVGSFLLDRQC